MAKGTLRGLPGEAKWEIDIPQPEDRAPGRDGGKYRHVAIEDLDSGEA